MELIITTRSGSYGLGWVVLVTTVIETEGYKYGKTTRSVSNTFPTKELAKDFEKIVTTRINSSMSVDEIHSTFKSIPSPTFDKKDFETRILIFREKYGNEHYIVRAPEDFEKVCISKVKERNDERWYSHLDSQKEPQKPSFTKDNISTLPVELQPEATKTWNNYVRDMKTWKEFQSLVQLRDKALSGNGPSASEFIQLMNSGEYEGYEIVTPIEYD